VRFAASVDWNPEELFAGPEFRKLVPFTMFALKATQEAFADAGSIPVPSPRSSASFGAIVGTGIGGISGIVEQHSEMMGAVRGASRRTSSNHGQRRQRPGCDPPRPPGHGLHHLERLRLVRPRDRDGSRPSAAERSTSP
jgi:3-oxoacyl-(acyl-carrier-protein) synthase